MPKYKVTLKNGDVGEIEAAGYEHDGAGARFHDIDGKIVASFVDGQVATIINSDIVFAAPAPEVSND